MPKNVDLPLTLNLESKMFTPTSTISLIHQMGFSCDLTTILHSEVESIRTKTRSQESEVV